MLRRLVFAFAGVALAALLALDRSPRASAADPDASGNWILTYSSRAALEQSPAIIKVEAKDGKPSASVLFTTQKGAAPKVADFQVKGRKVTFALGAASFEGTMSDNGKTVVGNYGNDQTSYRARLTRTDKTELAANEVATRAEAPAPAAEAQKLATAVLLARSQATREKDAAKRKELLAKAAEAQKAADEKTPGLLRELVAKHADTPFGLDAALDLLRGAAKYKVTAPEGEKFLALVEKQAEPYGERYARAQVLPAVEAMAGQKELAGTAEAAALKLHKAFTEKDPAAYKSRVLAIRKAALEALGKAEEAKAVSAELAKLEGQIDAEYLKSVPPFKPAAFAGRKDKGANQVAVMELFTGAQCPPCVAADVAFDALEKSYKPSELILIQYHMHIPGPDPLTNPDTVARWDYYRGTFPMDIRGTPSTLFNGKPQAGGGGGMAAAERKYEQYADIINPILERKAEVKVGARATRSGDKVDVALDVTGAKGDNMKLVVLVLEESVKYVGGNQLRFHHHVVRAMPLGAGGVAVKEKEFKHTASVDLAGIRKNLTKYLDDYAENTRPFPKPDRPMEMKELKVVALVQNDETKEIVQAVQVDVPEKGAGQ